MTVTVKMLVTKVKLDVVYATDDLLEKEITTSDISRPGLEMTGYFDYYAPERLQLFGMKEWSYLTQMTSHNRYSVLKEMFKKDTPAVIVSRGLAIPEEMVQAAQEEGIALFSSRVSTSRLAGEMSYFLDASLAERTSVHGVLMDIYGMGVLIQGDSGIGKSETGLELVKRGHRLVADDRVDVFAKDEETLWGSQQRFYVISLRFVVLALLMSCRCTVLVLSRIPHRCSWLFIWRILRLARSLTAWAMAMKRLPFLVSVFQGFAFLSKQVEMCQWLLRLLP